MTKKEIKKLIRNGINPVQMCGIRLKYDVNNRYFFPVSTSDRLFLGANEDDFILDGYTIRRFTDVVKAEIVDGKQLEISKAEGVIDSIETPDIDLTDWYSVFVSLQVSDKFMIIEHEDLDEKEWMFAIGKINKVTKTKVYFRHFNADGKWDEDLWEIPFNEITSVSFETRYVDIFSKYVD